MLTFYDLRRAIDDLTNWWTDGPVKVYHAHYPDPIARVHSLVKRGDTVQLEADIETVDRLESLEDQVEGIGPATAKKVRRHVLGDGEAQS